MHVCECKCVNMVLHYYSKQKSALSITHCNYDAISSTDTVYDICPTTSAISLFKHKIRVFTIDFMCEYIGIRLTSYVEK